MILIINKSNGNIRFINEQNFESIMYSMTNGWDMEEIIKLKN